MKVWWYAIAAFFAVFILRNAWIAEDAYISFRTLDHLLEGYGLRWNIAERVQSFTHPLWLFSLAIPFAITKDIYLSSILLSVLYSTVAIYLLVRNQEKESALALAATALLCSKAFIDFTTSGLENPASFLLIAVLFSLYLHNPKNILHIALAAALLALNRLDTVVFAIPLLAHSIYLNYTVKKQIPIKALLLGLSPIIIWELFSIIYYGFPFPNTYYAKLHTQIPKPQIYAQGLLYYLDSIGRDPTTLITIVLAFVFAWRIRSFRFPLVGIALYLLYIINIGGDFMTGRFFAVPFFAATFLIVRSCKPEISKMFWGVAALFVVFTVVNPNAPIKVDRHLKNQRIEANGIADEKGFYFANTGFLNHSLGKPLPSHFWVDTGREWGKNPHKIHVYGNVGIAGFYTPAKVHVVDYNALTDAFVARLPAENRDFNWRPGHFGRDIPEDYILSLSRNENLFRKIHLRDLYDDIMIVTRGRLFSAARWRAIVRLNLGL